MEYGKCFLINFTYHHIAGYITDRHTEYNTLFSFWQALFCLFTIKKRLTFCPNRV